MAEDQTQGQRLNFQKPQLSSLIPGGGGQTQQTQQDTSGQQATGGIFLPGISNNKELQSNNILPTVGYAGAIQNGTIKTNVDLPGITSKPTTISGIDPHEAVEGMQRFNEEEEKRVKSEYGKLVKRGVKQLVGNVQKRGNANLSKEGILEKLARIGQVNGADYNAMQQYIDENEAQTNAYNKKVNDAFSQWEKRNMDMDIMKQYEGETITNLLSRGDAKGATYKLIKGLSENITMIPEMVVTMVAPEVGLPLIATDVYIQESQSTYEDLIENGATYEQAQNGATIVGLANASIELLLERFLGGVQRAGASTLRRMFLKNMQKEVVRNVTKKGFMEILGRGILKQGKTSSVEGLEEILQQLVSNAFIKTVNPDKELSEGMVESFDQAFWQSFFFPLGGGSESVISDVQSNREVEKNADLEALDYVMQGEERKAQRMQQAKQNMKDKFLNKEVEVQDQEQQDIDQAEAQIEEDMMNEVLNEEEEDSKYQKSDSPQSVNEDTVSEKSHSGNIRITPENSSEISNSLNEIKKSLNDLKADTFLKAIKDSIAGAEGSNYITNKINGRNYVLRVSDHNANANNAIRHPKRNSSIVIKLMKRGKDGKNMKFKKNNKVDMVEFVYDPANMTPQVMQGVIDGIQNWLQTGEYTDTNYDSTKQSTRKRGDTKYQLKYEEKGYKPGVAGKNEKSISGKEGVNLRSKLNKQTIKQLAEKYGIKVEVIEGMIEILENGKRKGYAYGKYIDQLLTLSEEIKESTAPHELLHAIFDMIDPETKAYLISQVMQSEGWSAKQAEEWLADSFSNFYRTGKIEGAPKSTWGKIKMFFKRVRSFINGLGKWRSQLEEIFTDIIESEGIEDLQGKIDQNKSLNEAKAQMKKRFMEYAKNAQKMQKKAKKSEAKLQKAEDIRDLTLNNEKKEGAYDPRASLPKVRGGWTKAKIEKQIKEGGATVGISGALRAIQEFDSPEDFRAHTFYHGTQGSFVAKPSMSIPEKTFDRIADNFGGGYGQRYWAISLTTDKRIASRFGGASDHVNIYPVILRKNATVIEMPELEDSADLDDYIEKLWNDGVDAVWIGDKNSGEKELAVLNPRAIVDLGASDYYRQYRLGSEDNPLRIKSDADFDRIYNNAGKYIEELRTIERKYINVKDKYFLDNFGSTPGKLMDEDWNKYKEAKKQWESSKEKEEYDKYKSEYNKRKWEIRDDIRYQEAEDIDPNIQSPNQMIHKRGQLMVIEKFISEEQKKKALDVSKDILVHDGSHRDGHPYMWMHTNKYNSMMIPNFENTKDNRYKEFSDKGIVVSFFTNNEDMSKSYADHRSVLANTKRFKNIEEFNDKFKDTSDRHISEISGNPIKGDTFYVIEKDGNDYVLHKKYDELIKYKSIDDMYKGTMPRDIVEGLSDSEKIQAVKKYAKDNFMGDEWGDSRYDGVEIIRDGNDVIFRLRQDKELGRYKTEKQSLANARSLVNKKGQYHYKGIIQNMHNPLVVDKKIYGDTTPNWNRLGNAYDFLEKTDKEQLTKLVDAIDDVYNRQVKLGKERNKLSKRSEKLRDAMTQELNDNRMDNFTAKANKDENEIARTNHKESEIWDKREKFDSIIEKLELALHKYYDLTDTVKEVMESYLNQYNIKEWRSLYNDYMKLIDKYKEFYSLDGGEKFEAFAKKNYGVNDATLSLLHGIEGVTSDNGEKILKDKWMQTNDFVFYALRKGGYDGVMFGRIHDYGGDNRESKWGGNVLVSFNSNQFKSWDNADPTDSEFISYQLADDLESEAFKKRFGNSKVVDYHGNPKVVYHGTPNGEFWIFDRRKASVEGDRGAGFYFTDSDYDANANYVGGGPDFDNKVARLAETIEQDEGISYEEAKEKAREQLYVGDNQIDAVLKIENPVRVGEDATDIIGEWRDNAVEEYNEEDFDNEDDYYRALDEARANALDDIHRAIWNIGLDYGIDDAIQTVDQRFMENDYGTAQQLKDYINQNIETEMDGQLANNEVARAVLEGLGYDGIIDNSVSEKFKNMGLNYGTTHYIVFEPNQIKSATDNKGTYDPNYNDIRYQEAEDNEGRTLSPQQAEYFKDSVAREDEDLDRPLVRVRHTTTDSLKRPFSIFNPVGTPHYRFGDQIVNYYTDDVEMSASYANGIYNEYDAKGEVRSLSDAKEFLEKLKDERRIEFRTGDPMRYTLKKEGNGYRIYNDWDNEEINDMEELWKEANLTKEEERALQGSYEEGSMWDYGRKVLGDRYVDNGMEGEFGEIKKNVFAGEEKLLNTAEERGTPFGKKYGLSNFYMSIFEHRKNPGLKDTGMYFETEKDLIDNLENEIISRMNPSNKWMYEGYVNLTNPYIVDAEGRNWDTVRMGRTLLEDILDRWNKNSKADKDRIIKVFEDAKQEFEEGEENEGWDWYSYGMRNEDLKDAIHEVMGNTLMLELDASSEMYGAQIVGDAVDTVLGGMKEEDIQSFLNSTVGNSDAETTNDVVKFVIESNKKGETNYDGVIIKNVLDYGGDVDERRPHNVYVTFASNQFKSIYNENPTDDEDIRHQIAEYDYDENGRRTNLKFGEDNSEFDPSIFDRSREDQMDADKENEKSSPFYNAWVRYNAQNYKDDQLTLEEFINEISKRGDKEQEIYDQKMRDIGEAQNDPQLLDLQLRAVKLMEEEGKVGKKFGKNVSKEVRDRQQREVESKREKLVQDIVDYMYPGLKTEEITYDMQKDADQKEAEWEMLGREDIEEKLKYFKKDKNGNREAKEIKVENPDIKLEKILSSGKWEEIFTPVDRVIEWKTPQGQKGRIDRLKEPAKYKRFFEKIYDPKTKTKVEVKDVTKEVRALEKYRADEEAEKARKKKERQEAFAKKQQEEYKKLVRMKAFQRIIDMQWLEKYPFLSEDEIKTRYGFTDEEWKKITEQDEIKLPKKRGDRAISDFNKAVYSQVKALKEGLTWQNNMKQREAEKNLGEIGEIDIDVLLGRDEEKGQKEVEEFEKIAKEEKKKTKKEKTKRLEQAREDVTKVEIDKERENSKSEKERIDRLIKSTKTDRTVRGSVKQFTSDILTPVSTKIRNISKKIHMEVMRYFQNKDILTNTRLKEVDPFLKAMGKIRKENPVRFMDIWVALANRNIGYANGLLEEYGVKVPTKLLDTIYDEAEDVGLNINYLGSYYPLSVKAPKSFLEELMKINKGDIASQIEERIRKESQKKGGPLEESEITAIINEVIAGEDKGPDVNTGNKHLKKRNTEIRWTPKMLEYCDDPISTLISYIEGMTQSIERAKFLGKSRSGNVHTLADYVYNAKNGLTPDQQDELMDLLKAVFNDESPNKFIQTWRDLGTLTTLGSPSSTLTQLGDLSFSVYENGWRETLKAVRDLFASRGAFNLVDMGVLNRGEEYTNINSQKNLLQKAIHNVFKLTFFSTFDTFGKSTYIQSTWRKRQKRAKQGEKGDAQFRKDIMKWTDDEFMTDKIINDIKQGRFSQEVALLMYMKLSNIQPLTKAQMPKVYLNNPNGRLFYQFKTFGIKQLDYVLQETKEQTKNFKNLSTIDKFLKIAQVANMVFIMTLLGVGADELKDLTMRRRSNSLILRWLMGEKVGSEQIWEKMADNVLKLFGLSRYTVMQMKSDPVEAITSLFTTLPATNLVNYPFKDIYKAFKDDGSINWRTASSYQLIPLVGKYRYWIFGGGQEKQKEALKKSKKKKKSGGSLL